MLVPKQENKYHKQDKLRNNNILGTFAVPSCERCGSSDNAVHRHLESSTRHTSFGRLLFDYERRHLELMLAVNLVTYSPVPQPVAFSLSMAQSKSFFDNYTKQSYHALPSYLDDWDGSSGFAIHYETYGTSSL